MTFRAGGRTTLRRKRRSPSFPQQQRRVRLCQQHTVERKTADFGWPPFFRGRYTHNGVAGGHVRTREVTQQARVRSSPGEFRQPHLDTGHSRGVTKRQRTTRWHSCLVGTLQRCSMGGRCVREVKNSHTHSGRMTGFCAALQRGSEWSRRWVERVLENEFPLRGCFLL